MSSPARSASLPKATHPGGVNDSEQVTVFHPLNGSGARGTTGRSNPRRRKQEGYPKVPHPRDTIAVQIQRPVVPHLPKISTGLPFLFRSPEPLFLLQAKEKVVLAPAGQAEKQSPRRAGKNSLKIPPPPIIKITFRFKKPSCPPPPFLL